MNYIILVGAFQSLVVLALFLIIKRRKSYDSVLSWLLVFIFLHLGGNFFINTVFPNSETHKQFNTFITLLYTPLLYLFATKLAGNKYEQKVNRYYLFAPPVIAAIAYFNIAAYTIANDGKTPGAIVYYNNITSYAIIISCLFYSFKSLKISRLVSPFWEKETQLIRLIAYTFIGLGTVWLLTLVVTKIFTIPFYYIHWGVRCICYLALLGICLAIARVKILSLRFTNSAIPHIELKEESPEPELLSTDPEPVEEVSAPEVLQRKQLLSREQQAAIVQEMDQLMERTKLYTNAALTLDLLAAALKVSRHHLSESLNQFLGKSFYQYINEYRVKEMVTMMDSCKQKNVTPNILSFAYEAGFSSKSSFNQYFKKVVGCTPSAYMKGEEKIIPSSSVSSHFLLHSLRPEQDTAKA